jgi:hypothetical protein
MLVQEEAANRAAETIRSIQEKLQSISAERRDLPVTSDQKDATPLIFRAAFLVATGDAERFQIEAERLDATYGERGYRVAVAGPWAPYSFVGHRGD